MDLYAPPVGGTFLGSARYPGHDPSGVVVREVRCGTLRPITLGAGDLVTLVDVEGGGPALINATDDAGRSMLAALGVPPSGAAPSDVAPPGIASSGCHGARAIDVPVPPWADWRERLAAWRIDAGALPWRAVFEASTERGERLVWRCETACTLWIGVPATDFLADGGAGTLRVEIARPPGADTPLPEPIGEVREEFRIDRATARAYTVRAGDYVQIIDVEGRQCSDFLAFRRDALERGLERFVDSTVTRTLVGGAYPRPGLFDKFFDQDMRPLVSVVRDTVGRHDTFALACTARGYEERGFPGHVNCSDNISAELAAHGVNGRRAWPAINFFFNSWIDASDARLASDETWSRPGDHVVMRAQTDLLCVSTACPDDIDPINGWNPTDIHVRIYRPDRPLRRAVAHRPHHDSEAVMTEESAFHPATSKLTRSFAVARDVWTPTSYEGTRARAEYWACRERVTLQDMSSLRKYDITGPDADRLLQRALSRNVARLSANRSVYALMLADDGSVIDDGTLFRLADGAFRWCCGSEQSAEQLVALATEHGDRAWIRSRASSLPTLAVQGPHSRELLRRVVFTSEHHPALDNLKWFGFTIARLHDRDGPAFMLSRTGFTGELGYEIFCDAADAVRIWEALMSAGHDLGITPMGSEALEMLRIEAGLMVADHEFGPDSDAYESGLGFAVDMNKGEFVGREALLRNRDTPRRKLVGLRFDGDDLPAHGDAIYHRHRRVGTVTSATSSPTLECAIALARLSIEHAELDTRLEIGRLDGRIKRLPATVTAFPFVDPTRARARA